MILQLIKEMILQLMKEMILQLMKEKSRCRTMQIKLKSMSTG